ncbi:hypothetical protein BG000_000092, partial [Podila horticola]
MKINSCLLIAIATAITLTSSFTDAKRDSRDVVAAAPEALENTIDPSDFWKQKQHHHHSKHNCQNGKRGKRHGKHKKCKTHTVVVFAPCTHDTDDWKNDRLEGVAPASAAVRAPA